MSASPGGGRQARLWPSGAIFLCAEAGGYLMPLLLGPVSVTYGIGEATAGVTMGAQLAAFAIAAVGLSPWVTTFSPRRGAMLALLLVIMGNLFSAASPLVWGLVAGRVLAGLGEGFAAAVATAAIARSPDPDRSFAHVFTAVVLMALAIFLLLPGLMAGQDARMLFLGIACLPLLGLPALAALPDTRPEAPMTGQQRYRPFSLDAAVICLAITLYSVAANAYWVYIERIATAIGMTPAAYGRAFALGTVCALAGPLVAGWLGTRVGRLAPLLVGGLLVGGGGWLATHADSPVGLIAGLTVSSAAFLFGMPYLLGLAAEVDPSGRVAGASRGFNNAGSALAPILGGLVLSATGAYSSIGWTSLAAAFLALGLVVWASSRLARRAVSSR